MNTILSLFLSVFFLFFTGCETNKSTNLVDTTMNVTFNGKVVDGYISGATVCLDLDADGACDSNQAATTTAEDGSFKFSNIELDKNSIISIIASGGKDTATGKKFIGELRTVLYTNDINENQYLYITPLTDLLSSSFLLSETKDSTAFENSTREIAVAYRIYQQYIYLSPSRDSSIFGITQGIQHTIALLTKTVEDSIGRVLTAIEIRQVQKDIKSAMVTQISEDDDFILLNVVSKLESKLNVIIPNNKKTFIELQVKNIKLAIDKFTQIDELTSDNHDDYQAALETEMDKVYLLLDEADSIGTINPVTIDIDIFYVPVIPDENLTIITTLNGTVVDGYISGAKVCLDLNFNGICNDLSEPRTTTSEVGEFNFDNVVVDKDSFISIIAYGGIDIATNKEFVGELKTVIDTNKLGTTHQFYITPLTDLMSKSFIESSLKSSTSFDTIVENIATAYKIDKGYIDKSPIEYERVYAVSQEIQQAKALMEVIALKAKGISLTPIERKELQSEIAKALVSEISENSDLSLSNVLTKLEVISEISISVNEKVFLDSQMRNIKLALGYFTQNLYLTLANLNDFQLALENKADSIYELVNSIKNNSIGTIDPIVVDINIFNNDENTTVVDDNVTEINTTLNGTVVDGYISGAYVCLDLDFNGICNLSEPLTITSEVGEFNFNNLVVDKDSFISIIAYGGIDIATNKAFVGELKTVIDTNKLGSIHQFYITPITDLISKSFIESSVKSTASLDGIVENIATAYKIDKGYIGKSPTEYERVYSVSQEIQQTKALIEVIAIKAKAVSLTSVERKELRSEIGKALVTEISENSDLSLSNVLTKLESISEISIADNEKLFVESQMRNIKLALDNFTQNLYLTLINLNDYQLALENKADTIYELVNSIENNSAGVIDPIIIDINILNDDNTTVVDDNVTDENTTVVDENLTNISFSGVMVDGYIDGATICLDFNYNGICDSTEPYVLTATDGIFNFSNIQVQVSTMVPVIGFGGIDINTNKAYIGELKTIISTDNINSITQTLISPLTDLIAVDFLVQDENTSIIYENSLSKLEGKFILDSNGSILKDPMQDLEIFSISQELEHIKRVIELVVKKTTSIEYTDIMTKDLQSSIKKVLLTQINEFGYDSLNLDRVVSAIEIDLGITIASNDRDFISAQILEIKRVLDILVNDANIYTYTLPRIQSMLEKELEIAYTDINITDLSTMTVDNVIYSAYSKIDAIYDKLACVTNEYYINTLSDSNITSLREDDLTNGLSVNADNNDTTIYYPNLTNNKIGENVVVFRDDYYFSFDKSWINMNANVYIKSFNISDNNYECYKVKLDSSVGTEINFTKVYSYSDK